MDQELAVRQRQSTERARSLLRKAMKDVLGGAPLHEPIGLFIAPTADGRTHAHLTWGWRDVGDLGDEVRRCHEQFLSARTDAELHEWLDGDPPE